MSEAKPDSLRLTENLKLSKLDAALRQLNEAIRMLFDRRDPIATHTVASAAGLVLRDLAKTQGIDAPGVFAFIKEDQRAKFQSCLHKAQNFAKHADRDPTETLDFNVEQTHFMLFQIVWMCGEMKISQSHEMLHFKLWFMKTNPECYKWEVIPEAVKGYLAALPQPPNPADPLDPYRLDFYGRLFRDEQRSSSVESTVTRASGG